MPTAMKRYTVNLPDDVLKVLKQDCYVTGSAVGAKIISILLEHYQVRIPQPMIFGQPRPVAAKSKPSRLLVFGGPSQPAVEQASDRRASRGGA